MDQLLIDMDKNRVSGFVLIDFRKAFDMVDHSILLAKLQAYDIDDNSIMWIRSYLNERLQCVSLSDVRSETQSIPHGIPQGSILGPLFFIIFIYDLPLERIMAHMDLYADDTTLTYSADYCDKNQLEKPLNESISNVSTWATADKLPLNEMKTKALLIIRGNVLARRWHKMIYCSKYLLMTNLLLEFQVQHYVGWKSIRIKLSVNILTNYAKNVQSVSVF